MTTTLWPSESPDEFTGCFSDAETGGDRDTPIADSFQCLTLRWPGLMEDIACPLVGVPSHRLLQMTQPAAHADVWARWNRLAARTGVPGGVLYRGGIRGVDAERAVLARLGLSIAEARALVARAGVSRYPRNGGTSGRNWR